MIERSWGYSRAGGLLWLLVLCAGCRSLPALSQPTEVGFIPYQTADGVRILPTVRQAGSQRSRAWQDWLNAHRHGWQPERTAVTGRTLWCVQWLDGGQPQRLCNRNNETLVWFGYGIRRDADAVRQANAVWLQN